MHIGLVLLTTQIGGTERRFANLFSYLSQHSRHTYTLVLPVGLFDKLQKQGLLNDRHPRIVKLFTRRPVSLYNALPFKFRGRYVRGGIRLFSSLWRYEIRSPYVQDLFSSFDIIHWAASGSRQWQGVLPTQKPLVMELQNANLSKSKLVDEGIQKEAFFNVASQRIRDAYCKGVENDVQKRFIVSPCSFIDYSKMFVATKEKIIIFLGRMEGIKNPELFVEAISQLTQSRQDFRAYMLGTGELNAKIDKLIKIKKLQHILVRQFHTHPQEILSKSLIFVSLQPYDNYHSQALMEGMACGCAIVASDVGETWRLVSDDVGFRVSLNVKEIVERTSFLMDNPNIAVEMGLAARKKVMTEQSIEKYIEYLEALYQQVYKNWKTKNVFV